ncbi:MAG: hypothetical protein MZV63_35870 [Marinilabiliales bacterium]|nr:hypothetical protein [Marinilabiliales bacterium]
MISGLTRSPRCWTGQAALRQLTWPDDIRKKPRLNDAGPDIGAYERQPGEKGRALTVGSSRSRQSASGRQSSRQIGSPDGSQSAVRQSAVVTTLLTEAEDCGLKTKTLRYDKNSHYNSAHPDPVAHGCRAGVHRHVLQRREPL